VMGTSRVSWSLAAVFTFILIGIARGDDPNNAKATLLENIRAKPECKDEVVLKAIESTTFDEEIAYEALLNGCKKSLGYMVKNKTFDSKQKVHVAQSILNHFDSEVFPRLKKMKAKRELTISNPTAMGEVYKSGFYLEGATTLATAGCKDRISESCDLSKELKQSQKQLEGLLSSK
jgi:hypothetical protein